VLDDFTVGTRPLRVEVNQFTAPPGYGAGLIPQADPAAPPIGPLLADLDTGHYSRGTPSGELLVGGTEPACDPLHWIDDPDQVSQALTQETYRAQAYRAARRMPELTVPNTPRGIVGVYDVCDDWIPIYDRTALPGFYVAIGTSGNQFKNAPLVGRFLAEIITACENGRDHDATPVTLALPRTGSTVDLGQYRRTRPITTDSSFTVMG
jgi:sarcosine oxidase, subunit beta